MELSLQVQLDGDHGDTWDVPEVRALRLPGWEPSPRYPTRCLTIL